MITYRKAKPNEQFKEFDNILATGEHRIYIALFNDQPVGFVSEQGNGHLSMLYVDESYRRQGIASALMGYMVCDLKLNGFDKITVCSTPFGLPFFEQYGFKQTGSLKMKDGLPYIPMEYLPNEIWDIIDEKGNKTGRTIERGRKLADGDYHRVVHVWKHNKKGEWLIDKRSSNRGTSIDSKWETTGGSAIFGDDSLTAALRETKEELGIDLDPEKGVLFHTVTRHGYDGRNRLQDAWVFEHDCPIEDIRLQEGETCDVMWASPDKIREMMRSGDFLNEWFYPYFVDMVEKWRVSDREGNNEK